ncbi:MAG: RNA polymerase sigma factor [Spirochaetia bacterium]|nr:RNA polymerase sigma factor [Spirochaetia bacterium]
MSIENTYRRERNRILAWIRSRISDPEDAEDMLQEAFLAATAELDSVGSLEYLAGYVYAVLRNKVIDWYRRRRAQGLLDSAVAQDLLEQTLADPSIGPERQSYQALLLEELAAAIEELSPEQKFAFVQSEIEGKTLRQISEETGIPEGTLAARKSYAREYLAKRLNDIRSLFLEET